MISQEARDLFACLREYNGITAERLAGRAVVKPDQIAFTGSLQIDGRCGNHKRFLDHHRFAGFLVHHRASEQIVSHAGIVIGHGCKAVVQMYRPGIPGLVRLCVRACQYRLIRLDSRQPEQLGFGVDALAPFRFHLKCQLDIRARPEQVCIAVHN